MKQNVFSRAGRLREVFKSEKFLYPEFVPDRLPFRDAEIDSLVYCFQPLTKGLKAQNAFVFGKTGVGKTACVKFVLNELEEFSDRVKALYVNCFEFNSRHSIISKLSNFLRLALPSRGLSTAELYDRMLEALRKSDFTPIVVLDEFDQLLVNDGQALLYDLLRVTEQGLKSIPLIIVSNRPELVAGIDERVKSSLQPVLLNFEPYTPMQLKEILKERCQYAFLSNALENEVINVAAAHAAKLGGDARIAIESLLKAGRIAERENSETVSLKHLREAFQTIEFGNVRKKTGVASSAEKQLLEIISSKPQGIDSGALLAEFKLKGGKLGSRRIRELVSSLEKQGVVSTMQAQKGKGKTRLIKLKA